MDFVCSECGKRVCTCTMQPKCECGGLWDLDFVPPRFSPEDIDRDEWSIFRYRKFMALSGEAWRQVSLGGGDDTCDLPKSKCAFEDGLFHAHPIL